MTRKARRRSPREPPEQRPARTADAAAAHGPASGRGRVWLLEGLLFGALAVAATWPLSRHLTSHLPMGTEPVATVPLFNLWTLWWNADRLQSLYAGYWDAPIFHPVRGAFAFSEPQPLTGAVAAILSGLSGSRAFGYNAVLLLGLALNGWVAGRLLEALGMRRSVYLVGGAMIVWLPFVHQELGVLQLVSLGGVLATLLALVRLAAAPTIRRGVALGLAFAATGLMCGYYFVSASLLVLVGGGWLLGGHRFRETLRALLAAALVALALLLPVLGSQARVLSRHGLERSTSTASRFAAGWRDYVRAPAPQLVPLPGVATAARPGARAFWPGTLKVALAVGALAWEWRSRRRRWTLFLATSLTASVWLSLGPGSAGASLYDLASGVYPGIAQMRSPFRFAVFAQLATALLAAGALEALAARLGRRGVWATVLVVALGGAAALEVRLPGGRLLPLPAPRPSLPWIDWVTARTAPGDVFAFLPFPEGRGAADYLETTQWMYWQMRHGRPMANGYSGFFPVAFRELKATVRGFPDPPSLERLATRGVRFCAVARGTVEDAALAAATASGALRRRFGDDVARLDVYEILPRDGVRE